MLRECLKQTLCFYKNFYVDNLRDKQKLNNVLKAPMTYLFIPLTSYGDILPIDRYFYGIEGAISISNTSATGHNKIN